MVTQTNIMQLEGRVRPFLESCDDKSFTAPDLLFVVKIRITGFNKKEEIRCLHERFSTAATSDTHKQGLHYGTKSISQKWIRGLMSLITFNLKLR